MRGLRVRAWMALVLVCGLVSSGLARAADPLPWEAEAFSASPEATLQAATQLQPPKEEDVDLLLEETKYQYDADRRVRKTQRQVYRVLTEEALEDWAVVNAEWASWHQERPQIRARVISTDGLAHELDPSAVTEGPADQPSGQVFRDRRRLIAPLPAVDVGAVVEWQIVIAEHRPFCDVGTLREHSLHSYIPIRNLRLIVESPEQGPPLLHSIRGSEVTPRISVENGIRRLEIGPLPVGPYDDLEGYLPSDLPLYPHAVVSNGGSWADVAQHYAKVVDTQIGSEPYTKLAREIVGDEQDRTALLQKLLDAVQKRIRYVGIEFGESSIVPHTPDETLKVRYGDCKDQSTLLVALLRALGHNAHVALLRVGRHEDLLPEIPALNAFDHAIVYVPGEPPLWIDPTAPLQRVGELPSSDKGRLALIASPDTRDLVHTPEPRSSDNRIIRTREVTLRPFDQGEIRPTIEYHGIYESDARSSYAANTLEESRTALEERLKESYPTARMVKYEQSDPRDLSVPIRMTYTAEGINHGVGRPQFSFHLEPELILDDLPWPLMQFDQDEDEAAKPTQEDPPAEPWTRKKPLQFVRPHVKELHYQVHLPVGFRVVKLPDAFTRHFGPVIISAQVATPADDLVLIDYRFDSGHGKLSPEETRALRDYLAELHTGEEHTWPAAVELEHLPSVQFAREQFLEALGEYRRVLAQHPDDLWTRIWYIEHLVELGQVAAACAEGLRATEIHPESAWVWAALGYARMTNEQGTFMGPGSDPLLAEAAMRKALELNPELHDTRWNLALMLEYGDGPRPYAPGPRLQQAADEYRQLHSSGYSDVNLPTRWLQVLAYAGNWAEIQNIAPKLEQTGFRDQMWVAAAAMTSGVPEARRKASELTSTNTACADLLLEACDILNDKREYATAADVAECALAFITDAEHREEVQSHLMLLRRFHRMDDGHLSPPDDPRRLGQLLHMYAFGKRDAKELLPMYAEDTRLAFVEMQLSSIRADHPKLMSELEETKRTRERRADIVSLIEFSSAGDAGSGYRIEYGGDYWYVVPRNGELRLLCPMFRQELLGVEALRCLNAGDEAGGRRWLEWAAEELPPPTGLFPDPLSVRPFSYLWNALKRNQLKVAAAVLAAPADPTEDSLKILTEYRTTTRNKLQLLQVDRALAHRCFVRKEYEAVLEIADRILASRKHSAEVEGWKRMSLMQLGRLEELGDFDKQLNSPSVPDSKAISLMTRADKAAKRGDVAEVNQLLPMIEKENPRIPLAGISNDLAWNILFRDEPPLQDALEHAVKANERSSFQNPIQLHTLATVHAELDHPVEARKFLLQTIQAREGRTIDIDQYILGRIAETCGFPDIATTHYTRVLPDENQNSTYHLAQRRLQKLQGSD